jgi:hypothetical protein
MSPKLKKYFKFRFTRDGSDKYVYGECTMFLADTFKVKRKEIRDEFRRHPNHLFIPISDMKQTIDSLRRAGFDLKDIYPNIHLVLYSG